MCTHPTRYDYNAYKEWRDSEDERQKEALRRFYQRNAAPLRFSWRKVSWFMFKLVFWAAVFYAVIFGVFSL